MIIKDVNGVYHDLSTGQVVSSPTEQGTPTPEQARKTTPAQQEVQTTGAQRVTDLIKQLSWGANAGLFALPDAAQRAIGKGLGLNEDEVFQFTRFFNRGEQKPKNIEERFARAVGEGATSGLPFTGILAAYAPTKGAVKAVDPAASVLKGIANDAISFIQRRPVAALSTDIAFGSAYETLRQAVEESVDPNDPNKEAYKNLLPMAAFVGLPLALQYSPTLMGARFAKDKIRSASANLADVDESVKQELGGFWKLPGVRIVPSVLLKRAEDKLKTVLGSVADSPESREALKTLEAAMAHPNFPAAGFQLNYAERTMNPALLKEQAAQLERLGPKELALFKERQAQNERAYFDFMQTIAPSSRQAVDEALRAAQQERKTFFDSLVKQQKDLTDAEVMAISQRLGPENLDMLNDELRGVLQANMEMSAAERRTILDSMGLRQGTSPEGLPMPTRENGKSLFPAVDIESAAENLIKKYRIERPSLRTPIPEPIRMLENFVNAQRAERATLEKRFTKDLVDQAFDNELFGSGKTFDEELVKAARNSARQLVGAQTERVAGMKAQKRLSLKDVVDLTQGRGRIADAQGNVDVFITPGTSVRINPAKIVSDAQAMALDRTGIDLNVPEALDYIKAAISFRNDSLVRYNARMKRGSSRIEDAQRFQDTGKAVYDDIEKLVLGSKALDKQQYDVLKSTLKSYRDQFETNLALLTTQRVKGGDRYLLPNEVLMAKAFADADSLRQLKAALQDTSEGAGLIERGALDWLRGKGVVDKNGLVDPTKMRQVLDRNKNIVDELPESVQRRFQDDIQMADAYIARMRELDQRRVVAEDNELDRLLTRAVRPDADVNQTLGAALKDPALMRKLVDQLGKDPESLAALRRAAYDFAAEGAQKGGALQSFLKNNEKSLQVLFKDTNHLRDLNILADLQRRVFAFADITGQMPEFKSLDRTLQSRFGAGVSWLATTGREAASGRIAPETGALAFMVRLVSSLENRLYDRLFTKALEDPQFAKAMTQVGTPEQAAKVAAELSKIGISPTSYLPRVAIPAKAELADVSKEAGREPRPAAIPAAKPSMPARPLPPAPPTRGTQPFSPRLPTSPPTSTGPSAAQMYMALFPNDPISAMLQNRQAPQPQPPGQ